MALFWRCGHPLSNGLSITCITLGFWCFVSFGFFFFLREASWQYNWLSLLGFFCLICFVSRVGFFEVFLVVWVWFFLKGTLPNIIAGCYHLSSPSDQPHQHHCWTLYFSETLKILFPTHHYTPLITQRSSGLKEAQLFGIFHKGNPRVDGVFLHSQSRVRSS